MHQDRDQRPIGPKAGAVIEFEWNVPPQGLQRAGRAVAFHNRPRKRFAAAYVKTFDTEANKYGKHDVAFLCRAAMARARIREPLTGPVAVTILFAYPIPKRHTGPYPPASVAKAFPTARPDIDNCVKLLLDGMNKIAYKDDGQVAAIQTVKLFVPGVIGTFVRVEPAPLTLYTAALERLTEIAHVTH